MPVIPVLADYFGLRFLLRWFKNLSIQFKNYGWVGSHHLSNNWSIFQASHGSVQDLSCIGGGTGISFTNKPRASPSENYFFTMKNYFHSLVFILVVFFGFSSFTNTEAPAPIIGNLHVVSQSSNSVTFDWDDCDCAPKIYTVKYVRVSDGYTSPEFQTANSNYTFGNLSSGTYQFFFKVDCNGGSSGFIGEDDQVQI